MNRLTQFTLHLFLVSATTLSAAAVEAPADFDDLTNGLVPQGAFNTAKEAFEEVEEVDEGLGPVYNAPSCSACHQNPVTGAISQINELRAGHNRQVVVSGALVTIFRDAPGGSLINDRSIPIDNTLTPPDIGAKLQERVPPLLTAPVVSGPPLLRQNQTVQTFRTSLNTLGDGFVEAVQDGTLQALSNSQNTITGGVVRGQAIAVPVLEANVTTNPQCANAALPCKRRIGRFGWKDQHASLLSFSADAYRNEMGITNRFILNENSSMGRPVPPPVNEFCVSDGMNCGEDGTEDINKFTVFMRATKAPPRDRDIINTFSASVTRGSTLFSKLPAIPGDPATYSCSVCHVPSMVTAPPGTVINGGTFTVPPALGSKTIRPFSDFLLHDIGTGDGIVQNGPQEDTVSVQLSTRNKMRTPPLWGVRTRNRLMHDGESLSFLEAIERHKGEALSVTNRFMALPDEVFGTCVLTPPITGCKQDVIRFLELL